MFSNHNSFITLVNQKFMNKNSHIHLVLETSFKESLKREAKNQNMCLSGLCRDKLRKNLSLIRIENLLIEIKEKLK